MPLPPAPPSAAPRGHARGRARLLCVAYPTQQRLVLPVDLPPVWHTRPARARARARDRAPLHPARRGAARAAGDARTRQDVRLALERGASD